MQCFQGFFICGRVKIHRKHSEIDEKQNITRKPKELISKIADCIETIHMIR